MKACITAMDQIKKALGLIFLCIICSNWHANAKPQEHLIYSFADHNISNEALRQEFGKGIILAFEEHMSESKNKNSVIAYGGDAQTAHTKTHFANKALGVLGIGQLPSSICRKATCYGIFNEKGHTKNANFFNISMHMDYNSTDWASAIHSVYKAKNIALLIEDMNFFDKHYNRIAQHLKSFGIDIATHIIPSSNNLAIKSSVTQLKKHDFDLILVVNEFNKSMKFLHMAERLGVNAPILMLSLNVQDKTNKNWFFFPSPYDKRTDIAAAYLKALDAFSGKGQPLLHRFETKLQPSIASYIGYIAAKALIQVAKSIPNQINPAHFAKTIEKDAIMHFDHLVVKFERNGINKQDTFKKILAHEYR
jgi:hypothetical protein